MIGSQRAFERSRGFAHGAVRKAILSGRLVKALLPDGRLDFDLADDELAATEWQLRINGPSLNGHSRDPELVDHCRRSRAAREAIQARLLGLEFERKTAGLVRAEDVKRAAAECAARARERIAALPDRLGSLLDEAGRIALQSEIERVLAELDESPERRSPD